MRWGLHPPPRLVQWNVKHAKISLEDIAVAEKTSKNHSVHHSVREPDGRGKRSPLVAFAGPAPQTPRPRVLLDRRCVRYSSFDHLFVLQGSSLDAHDLGVRVH